MKREPPQKRFSTPRSNDHPWKQKMTIAAMEKSARENSGVAKKPARRPWSCPGCGSVSCDFGECSGGNY